MKSKTYTYIDCVEFNNWGADLLNTVLAGYIDNSRHETSTAYFHVVLTTFAVEALTDIGNFENIHYTWLVGDYSSAVVNHNTRDFEAKMLHVWQQYKSAVKSLLAMHMAIENNKAYTSKFETQTTLVVNEVNVNSVIDSVHDMFN